MPELTALSAQEILNRIFDATNNRLNVFPSIKAEILYINEDANANMTVGLTINQGASDDGIVALKSSDVAHGMTDFEETDTYGAFSKVAALTGGTVIHGLSEDEIGLYLIASYTTDDTGKATNANAAVQLGSRKKSGTGATNPGANANVVGILNVNNGSMAAIFDIEGDLHLDAAGGAGTAAVIEGTNPNETIKGYNIYDDEPDWELARALHMSLLPDDHALRQQYADIVERYKLVLAKGGIVTYNPDGHHFVAMKRLALFQLDGLYQVGRRVFVEHEARFSTVEERLATVEEANRILRGQLQAVGVLPER